jgi:predicted ATPase/class 3 adenylate cyclase
MKFCGQCATPLTERQKGKRRNGKTVTQKGKRRNGAKAKRQKFQDAGRRTPDAGLPSGERRQLTVVFLDLVDSTPLSEQLDPEELHVVVGQYQEACAEVIHRFAGHIAQYLGDGLLVYFGYPVAHEDNAQRAVRAGLGILAKLHDLNVRLQQTITAMQDRPLRLRIGIDTGLVVVGELGKGARSEQIALGETPNRAARLQGLAAPNTLVMSGETYRLTQGFFECQELGLQSLKGVSEPVQVYRVLGESGVRSRLEVPTPTGLTPLVGREQELGLLVERWERVKGGEGQVVLLGGEAGIGKSRLVRALKEQVRGKASGWLECRCSPYYQHSAFYPVIDLLQRRLGFRQAESAEEKLSKLENALTLYGFPLPEVVPLFASLLSLPLPERYPPLSLTPQRQKRKILETLLAWLLRETERQPLILVWEDLPWIDPSSLELLNLLIEQVPLARLLIVLTFRSEFRPPWILRSHFIQLTLSRLSRRQVELIIQKVASGKALPPEVVQQVVRKTDGVPLFVEELTKAVLEAGEGYGQAPAPSIPIPATLHDSFMARLDRLGTAKGVAQLGATLGREFSYELLRAVSPLDETALQTELVRLVAAELLYQRGLPPQAVYIFRHALIQDAAYQSLLKSTRQQSHQQIAQVLQERFPETVETQPELLAHHCTEAGLIEQAIPHWQRAGERAVERSANVEAVSHLTKALELLQTLPDSPDRAQQELTLQIALGVPLMATKGYAAPEAKAAYDRALELCRQVGETPQLVPVLRGLAAFYYMRAELQTARKLGEQCLHLAQSAQDPELLLEAHQEMGGTLATVGEFAPALEHLQQGITLYNAQKHRLHTSLYGQDPGVSCLARASHVLWHLGYPEQALQKSQEAIALAQELSHPHSLTYALFFSASLHQLRRERQAAQEQAERVIALATEQGFPVWAALGTIVQGWALVAKRQIEEGMAQIRQGMDTCRAIGVELGWPNYLALSGFAYARRGQLEEALALLVEALDITQKTGQRADEAGLYVFKGELMLARSSVQRLASSVQNPQSAIHNPQSEAEACFLKAIELAQRQQAKSWALRAVVSLSRLWQRQGKKEAARQRLAEIFGWFTEGFDTADLREARALLDSLM